MDAKAQSDPCEETIDPFVTAQFKPLQNMKNKLRTLQQVTAQSKRWYLEKQLAKHAINSVSLNLQNLSGYNKTKDCTLAKSMQRICLYTKLYYISLKTCQITYGSLCIIKTSVNGNMPSGHRLFSFWYADLTDCHRRRNAHD